MTTFSTRSTIVLALSVLLASVAGAEDPAYPEIPIAGMMGLESGTGDGWLAVHIEIGFSHALTGLVWYNNDGEVVFPQVLAATGQDGGPGVVAEAVVVAEDVAGVSSGWSAVAFTQPVGAATGSLYLMFELPEGLQFEHPGDGGGPAFGYFAEQSGVNGWISGDGEDWLRLRADHSFAIAPVLMPLEEGMLVKSIGGEIKIEAPPAPVVTAYLKAGPNPFNPRVELKFGLPQAAHVILSIYDVRGLRIARVANQTFQAGHHSVFWEGMDDAGRQVASGVYFARFNADEVAFTQRLLLLK